MISFLDFEKPIAELEGKIHELRQLGAEGEEDGARPSGIDIEDEVARLQSKADDLLSRTYANLSPWQKVQVARHPNRPQLRNYVEAFITDFTPLAGDRNYADDKAITGGIGRFRGRSIMQGETVEIEIDVGVGRGRATVWTCDLTHGYISINADYRS